MTLRPAASSARARRLHLHHVERLDVGDARGEPRLRYPSKVVVREAVGKRYRNAIVDRSAPLRLQPRAAVCDLASRAARVRLRVRLPVAMAGLVQMRARRRYGHVSGGSLSAGQGAARLRARPGNGLGGAVSGSRRSRSRRLARPSVRPPPARGRSAASRGRLRSGRATQPSASSWFRASAKARSSRASDARTCRAAPGARRYAGRTCRRPRTRNDHDADVRARPPRPGRAQGGPNAVTSSGNNQPLPMNREATSGASRAAQPRRPPGALAHRERVVRNTDQRERPYDERTRRNIERRG